MSATKSSKGDPNEKLIAQNKRARYDFEIVETFECGMVLTGAEVKSLRAGHASLGESFARIRDGQVWLEGMHIGKYEQMGRGEYDETRARKLLLHKREIEGLVGKVAERGLTLVPMKVYFTRGIAKCLIGLGKGKKRHEKRQSIAERETKREMQRAMSRGR